MNARTSAGRDIDLPQDAIDRFRSRLRGQLLSSEDPGYEASRAVWNAMIDRRPGLIVRCLGVADVVSAVRFAREHDLLLSVKGGGHNIAGLAVCDGGLALDMSLMKGVWVDPRERVARAQPGCLLGDLDAETQAHGLAATLGFVSATGIAGLTLGGGFGYLTRRYGWTSDGVLSMQVVTADGRIVTASEGENQDLFWGLRGGGGNFGIVTGFEYRLNPIGPEILGGAIAWRAADAPRVLEAFRSLADSGPAELTCAVAMRPAPPAPWIDAAVHGEPIIILVICHTGPFDQGERHVATLRALGGMVGDVVQRRPYTTQQSLLDATQPRGRRYYWKSEYLPRLEPELLAKAPDLAGRIPSPHSALILFPIGGVLDRLPNDHSSVGNRDASVVLNITSAWERADDDAANIEWARSTWRELRRFSTGGTYINFLTEEEGAERTQAAYGPNLERLAEIKGRWDPENRFRVNKNIAPRPARTPA
jgi:FAD/FMN-containing dehydrogenase